MTHRILLLLSFLTHTLFSMEELPKKGDLHSNRFATHGMLIFLNARSAIEDPVVHQCMIALNQKAAPLLVSTAIFESLEQTPQLTTIANHFKNCSAISELESYVMELKSIVPPIISEYMNNAEAAAKSINERLSEKLKSFIHKVRSVKELYGDVILRDCFPNASDYEISVLRNSIENGIRKEMIFWNPHEWIIKAVDENQRLLLLIPKNYKDKLSGIDLSGYASQKQSEHGVQLTDIEYKTGLKIDHMQTLSDVKQAFRLHEQNEQGIHYFVDAITRMFVLRSEYAQTSFVQPRWAFYMNGHGDIGAQVAGISIDGFTRMLTFFDTKINTSFLYYNTCFSSGTNENILYKDQMKYASGKTFSFVIGMAGVVDDILATPYSNFFLEEITRYQIDSENKRLRLGTFLNYPDFIKTVTTDRAPDFRAIAHSLISTDRTGTTFLPARIRLPGREWFNSVEAMIDVADIGIIFAKTCTKVDLKKRFSRKRYDPRYFLLFAPIIPCELVLSYEPEKRVRFLPMAYLKAPESDEFMYYIKKITAPNFTLSSLVTVFTAAISSDYKMMVLIDEIETRLGPKEEIVLLKDVIITHGENKKTYLYATYEWNGVTRPYFHEVLRGDLFVRQVVDESIVRKLKSKFIDEIKKFEAAKEPFSEIDARLEKEMKLRKDADAQKKQLINRLTSVEPL